VSPNGSEADVSADELREIVRARFRASIDVPTAFFEANAEGIALACRDLARAFHEDHRLLVFGQGAQRSDAVHVSVEFVHPVIVGKRALPALALQDEILAQLRALGEAGDVALGLVAGGGETVRAALIAARELGLRTIAMVGPDGGDWPADHVFSVPSDDPYVVQEVHETAYHVLWELVHVFLEHPGTLK
jgi:D-sedoheptulose 7-phosphate isomerase